MRKRHLLKPLMLAAGLVFGFSYAQADEITATLSHTAGTQWGSNTNSNTVDSEAEYYNNDLATGWAGAAYAEFTFKIPEGSTVTSATLTYSVNQARTSSRDDKIYYMNPGFTLDYDALLSSNGQDLRYTDNRTIAVEVAPTGGGGDRIGLTQDVTDAVKAIHEAGQKYIIFQWTNNAASATLYGKASANAPTLTITTASAADMTTYTVKFTDGSGTEIKTAATYDVAIGSSATASEEDMASFFNEDKTKKYIYVSGNTEIASANQDATQNVITLVFREAATYSYTINASVNGATNEVSTGSNFEGETITYNYPRYYNVDGTLYEIAKNGSTWYQNSFVLDQDNKVVTVEGYTATDKTGVVFLSEAEQIETLTLASEPNAGIRMSMGQIARNANESAPALITTLPAGKYQLTSTVWGSKGTDFVFKAGDATVLTITTSGSSVDATGDEFTLNAETAITLDYTESGSRGIDYVLIQKTGDVEVPAAEYAMGQTVFAEVADLPTGSLDDFTVTADDYQITFSGATARSYEDWQTHEQVTVVDLTENVGSITVTGINGKRLNRIELSLTRDGAIKADKGTYEAGVWTGDEESVTFTTGWQMSSIDKVTVGDYVEPATKIENIGALKGIANNTNIELALNGATVTFVKDDIAFIEDATGGIKLNNIGLSLTAGTALNGNLYATYTGGSIPSLGSNAQTATSEFTSEETTVTPTLATVQGLNGMMYTNRLIKLVGSMSVSGNWLMFGSTSVWIDDYFNVLPDEYEYPSEIGSLLAIGGSDGAAQEIYPVSADYIIEPANVQPEKAANIAALRDMPGNIAVELTLTNAKVTVDETVAASGEDEGGEGGEPDPLADEGDDDFGVDNPNEPTTGEGERTIIVEDATGAVAISADVAEALGTVFTGSGIALNGSLTATLANTGGDISLSANDKTASSTVTSAAAEVMPTEMSVAESMVEENSLRLVKYVGATISGDATAGYTVTQPEAQIPAQVAMVDKFKKLAEVPTEAVDLTGVIYYDVYVGNFEFWPLSYTEPEPEPEQVYKTFTKSEVFLPTAENVNAAVAEGWVEHGGNYTDNKKGTIDPATGETLESPTAFPGVGLKKGNAGKSFVTYVTGVDEITAYAVSGKSSEERTLAVTATPSDGSEAVTGQASGSSETIVLTMALDPTKQYAIDYAGVNADGGGTDIALHGVKFTVTASEPQEYRKWDFTAWSQETKNNLEAEFQAAGYTEAPAPEGTETGWRRYEKDGVWTETDDLKAAGTIYWYGSYISEPTELKANGVTIAETKGLKFNNVTKLNNTVAIAIDYPETSIGTYAGGSYIWLNGGDLQITIPAVAPGQKVLMEVESHKNTDARGVKLSVNGTEIGEGIPTTKQSYEWIVPETVGTDPVDVLVSSTSGCHIYRIEVGDADLISVGINEVNADVKRVDNNVYTINGVMVRKAGESLDGLAKGLYIVGGKKIVVK